MLRKLRGRLTYANVVSTLCLFVVLGGSSYAAVKLGKNAVRARNIAPNAVRTRKVKNGSLLAKDFKAGQLPKGDKGDKGDTGPPGPTASASDSENPSSDLALSKAADTTYLHTTITTKVRSRIVANANADLFTSSNTPGQASCHLLIGGQVISQLSWSDFNATGGEDEMTPAMGAAVKPPGTYTVSLACKNESGAQPVDVYFDYGDLTVVAAAA